MKTKVCHLNGSPYLDINGTAFPFSIAELREFRATVRPARVRWLKKQIPAGSAYRKLLEMALEAQG